MVLIVTCWTSWSYIRTCHLSLQMVIKRENIITDQDYSHNIIIHVPRGPKALQIFYFWSLKSITSGSKLALIGLGKKITGRQAPDEYSRYSEDKYKYIVIFSSINLQICICKHSLQSLPWGMLRGIFKNGLFMVKLSNSNQQRQPTIKLSVPTRVCATSSNFLGLSLSKFQW